MSSIIVCGGGIVGLSAAAMLARDGHQVTVLEADPQEPPVPGAQAWESWQRRGVAQFRQPHNLFARIRQICDQELPGLTDRLLAAGCAWVDYLDGLPPTVADRMPRPGDAQLRFVTGRRPVTESVFATVAQDQPGVSVRRGVRVVGLLTGTPAISGIPHAAGVYTVDGGRIHADLVIDAMGRRSPSTRWLTAIGAREPLAHCEDRGFAYTFVIDGRPVVTGFAAVGDAWACTNPSAGRGLSIGLIHAQLLRQMVREHIDDPAAFAAAWHDGTKRCVAPYYDNQVAADRARIAEIAAVRDGREPPRPDETTARFLAVASRDPDVYRGLLETVLCLALPQDVLARPAIRAAVDRTELVAPPPVPGPDRTRLLQLLAG